MSNKKKAKNSQLVVRINDQERDAFVSLCEELDTSAAREVRRFIHSFILEHGDENTDVSDSAKDSTLK
jgi:hypothetical protein